MNKEKKKMDDLVGKYVKVKLTDGTTVEGFLHASRVKKNSYYCMNGLHMSRNVIFGISHVEEAEVEKWN